MMMILVWLNLPKILFKDIASSFEMNPKNSVLNVR
jgi:hypothetical protein